jgi:hypothetical protein
MEYLQQNIKVFNPFQHNAREWLSDFESLVQKCGELNYHHAFYTYLPHLLNGEGQNWYYNARKNFRVEEWLNFKEDFVKHFWNFKWEASVNAVTKKFEGGCLLTFVQNKLEQLQNLFPTGTSSTIITLVLASLPSEIASEFMDSSDVNYDMFIRCINAYVVRDKNAVEQERTEAQTPSFTLSSSSSQSQPQ